MKEKEYNFNIGELSDFHAHIVALCEKKLLQSMNRILYKFIQKSRRQNNYYFSYFLERPEDALVIVLCVPARDPELILKVFGVSRPEDPQACNVKLKD